MRENPLYPFESASSQIKRCIPMLILMAWSLAFPLPGAGKDPVVTSSWTEKAVNVDGQNDDWAGETLQFEKNALVDYAFRNDAEYLYVLFVFKNPKSLSSVESTGMTLFCSPGQKSSRDHGLLFISKAVTADELIAVLEKQGQALSEERKQQLRSKPNYLMYISQVVDKKGRVVAANAESLPLTPPSYRVGKPGEAVVYEFRIPLARVEGQPAGINVAPGDSLKVGFEWGGLTKEMRVAIASQSGFSGEGASPNPSSQDLIDEEGGGGGAGAGGPGFSSRMAQMRKKMKKYDFWVEVHLSKSKQ